MSAYVVDRNHILYLVQAASSRTIAQHGFSWYHKTDPEPYHKLDAGDYDDLERVANMLWQENIRSVMYRYQDSEISDLPGTTGEEYRITRQDFRHSWVDIDPIQALMSCRCYEYQSCEHPAWETSEAFTFIESLKDCAVSALPGYDDAEWGAPEPYTGLALRR